MIPAMGLKLQITEEVLNGDRESGRDDRLREYEEGEVLYEQGDTAKEFVLVRSGVLAMKYRTTGGKMIVLELVGPGELAGLISVMHDTPRLAILQAVTDSEVREYTADELETGRDDLPEWVVSGFSQLGVRMFELWDRQMSGARGNLETQLACVLCKLGMKFGETAREGLRIDFKITRKRLGELIGARTESVIRAIKNLEQEDILSSEDSRITIRDLPALLERSKKACEECFLRTDHIEPFASNGTDP